MKRILLFTFFHLLLFSFSYGQQTTIKGKVTDKKTGETLIGVTIALESKPGVGVTTDLDGNYTLILPDASVQTLLISYISYETKKEIIHPVKGETITKDFTLQSVSTDLGAVEVQSKAVRGKEYYMENIKKNASSSIDFISSETMKKTGDINVTAAVARVSGVSSSNNGFITVRGIGDRYLKTTINGSRIPTLDPFTNNIKLDLFPASLIDNVILTKTTSPELPGDWAGAYISLETKDYPDKLAINMETSVGYNAQTTFKDVMSSPRSKTDWLGYDNGFREYNHKEFQQAGVQLISRPSSENLSQYNQLVGLGLGDYLHSMGIDATTAWTDAYFVLGLVKLGLLDKELQTNTTAVNEAKEKYKAEGYRERAFMEYSKGIAKSGQSFKSNWDPITRKAPLNFSQSFSIGNQTKFLGRTLGVVAGFRYGSAIQYDPSADMRRLIRSKTGEIRIDTVFRALSKQTNTWSALMSLAYKLNINNSLSLLFMPNFSGVNNVSTIDEPTENSRTNSTNALFYEQRKQLVYQLKSEHFLPGPQLKIELNSSYTNGKSNAPDYKNIPYVQINDANFVGGDNPVSRYFRYLTDNLFDSRITFELPFWNSNEETQRKLKFGASYQNTERKNNQLRYDVIGSTGMYTGLLQDYYSVDKFGVQLLPNGSLEIPFYYYLTNNPGDNSFGNSSIKSGFMMMDYALTPTLRISGGLRVEEAYMYTDLTKFHAMRLKRDDPRRAIRNIGSLNLTKDDIANPAEHKEINYLPSASFIFKLKKDPLAPINLRLNFSQTIARPSLREISETAMLDYEYNAFVRGNSELKTVKIKNYDLRLESYFKSGDNVSVSFFYKDFRDHIELVQFDVISWQNVDKSKVIGIELEVRKSILKQLEFRSNLTVVRSQTTFVRYNSGGIAYDTITRSMFGQAPYIFNGILIYTSDSLGLTLTASYNVQGPRLAISSGIDTPDIYELPRHALDFKITKKLSRHFNASLTIRDILSQSVTRAYKYENWKYVYDTYRYGTNYVLGVSYQF